MLTEINAYYRKYKKGMLASKEYILKKIPEICIFTYSEYIG